MMYTQDEYTASKASLRRFIALYVFFAALLAGAFVYSLFARIEWLAYVSAVTVALFTLFLWGNIGGRLVVWNRFLNDMKSGMEREATGVVFSIDEQDTTKDGLEFRALRLLTGDEADSAGGRILYVDASRFPLNVSQGQRVQCRLFGNYIKDMKVLEEE